MWPGKSCPDEVTNEGRSAEATSREAANALAHKGVARAMKRRAAGSDRWPRSQFAVSAVASKRPRGVIEAHGGIKGG